MADETKTQSTASLLVRHGPRKGKKLVLKGESFRIGRESGCDLVLSDEMVSPVHTVIELRGDLWFASNRGAHGTLVNETPIEGSRTLAPGDTIQVGAETLLEFQVQKRKAREQKDRAQTGPVPIWQRPSVLAGVGIYVALLVGLGIWLASGGSEAVSAASASEALERSRDFLSSSEGARDLAPVSPQLASSADSKTDPAADFYRFVATAQGGGSREDVEPHVARLLENVDEALFRAWRLEQQERWPDAIRAYREVVDLAPTIRFPATGFAMSRIRVLESRLVEN